MPDGTKYADFANVHNYVIGNGGCGILADNQAWNTEDPTLNSCWDGLYGEYSLTWNKHFQGYPVGQVTTLPRVTTETGWFTEGNGAISEVQQGNLFLDLYLDAYKRVGATPSFTTSMTRQARVFGVFSIPITARSLRQLTCTISQQYWQTSHPSFGLGNSTIPFPTNRQPSMIC
jgi:hypothetical protein